ncbi:hypothetical protein AOLI_G00299650 [Acnodon oligacanthus]
MLSEADSLTDSPQLTEMFTVSSRPKSGFNDPHFHCPGGEKQCFSRLSRLLIWLPLTCFSKWHFKGCQNRGPRSAAQTQGAKGHPPAAQKKAGDLENEVKVSEAPPTSAHLQPHRRELFKEKTKNSYQNRCPAGPNQPEHLRFALAQRP